MSAVQDMVDHGDREIADLQAKLTDLADRRNVAQDELSTIAQAREARAKALSEARSQVEQAQASHTEAHSYAKLRHGKAGEKRAIKDASGAKDILDKANDALRQVEHEQAEASQADDLREQELHELLHKLEIEKEAHLAEIEAMTKGLDKARSELGQEKHAQFMQAYQEKESQLNDLLDQVIAAKVGLLQLHETAVQDLKDWPDLQRDVQRLRQPDNATIRLIEASLHFVDTFLADARDVEQQPPLKSVRMWNGTNVGVWSKLFIPDSELSMYLSNPHASVVALRQRRESLMQLFDEYIAYLNGDE